MAFAWFLRGFFYDLRILCIFRPSFKEKYLKESQGRVSERDQFAHWFTPHMAIASRAGPGCSQEPGHGWEGPSTWAVLCALAGSWLGSGAAATQTSARMRRAGRAYPRAAFRN